MLRFFAVFDERPKFFEIERAAEFAVVTFHTITTIERAESEMHGGVSLAFADVETAGTVATFAADIDEFRVGEFAAIAGRATEADRVATVAFRIRLGFARRESRECVRVSGRGPRRAGVFVAGETFLGANIR